MPSPPSYQKVNPADQSIFFIVLRSSTLSLAVLDEIAQSQVEQRISMVSGVAQVKIFGSQKFAVRVDVDPRELAARSIGIDEWPDGTVAGRYTFIHAFYHQMVYQQIAAARRTHLQESVWDEGA